MRDLLLPKNDSFVYDSNASFSNTTSNIVEEPFLSPQAFKLLADVFFSFIIVTGVVGNSLVTVVILRWKEIRTPCNIFLLNIAVADFLVTGIAGSFRIIEVHLGWIFGDFLCRFLAPLQDVFVGVSAISHSTISWERYRATVTPFKPRISKAKAKCMLPAIWLFSYITCGLPLVFTTKLHEESGKEYCAPNWSVLYRRVFEIFLVVMYIILQLVLQTFAYLNIIRALKSKEELLNESTRRMRKGSDGHSTNSAKEKKKSKTIKMLIVLVVVFQIGYIPRGTVMLIAEFASNSVYSEEFQYIELISLILYYLKHVLNPVILFLMSAEFKSALKSFLLCRPKNTTKTNEKVELQTTNAHAET